MKKSFLFLVAAVALMSGVFAPKSAQAVAAFARQVGVPCYSCHYQYMGPLNSFGREFKLGGFTQAAQDLLQDEGLSLTPVMNATVMLGSQISLGATGGPNGNNPGNWNVGNDASLFVAGRVAQDIGAIIELGGQTSPNFSNVKMVYSHNFGPVTGGLSLYRTDGAGPAFAMDLYNTGSNKLNWGWDSGDIFANLAAGPNVNAAEGLGLFAGNSLFFVNLGLYAPVGDNFNAAGGSGGNAGLNFAQYYRLALTPKIADGLDLMVGAQGTMGTVQVDMGAGRPLKIDNDSFIMDAQAQFELAGNQAQVVASFASIPSKMSGANNTHTVADLGCAGATPSPYCSGTIFNTGAKDISGFDVAFSYNLMKAAGVKAAYGSISNFSGTTNNLSGFGLGAWYDVAQNVHLAVEQFWYSGDTKNLHHDDSSTTIEIRVLF